MLILSVPGSTLDVRIIKSTPVLKKIIVVPLNCLLVVFIQLTNTNFSFERSTTFILKKIDISHPPPTPPFPWPVHCIIRTALACQPLWITCYLFYQHTEQVRSLRWGCPRDKKIRIIYFILFHRAQNQNYLPYIVVRASKNVNRCSTYFFFDAISLVLIALKNTYLISLLPITVIFWL